MARFRALGVQRIELRAARLHREGLPIVSIVVPFWGYLIGS